MKYLIINGSPRKQNTWKIIQRAKNRIIDKDKNAEFNEINLLDAEIPQCIGCFSCFMNGEDTCPHANKIQPIVDEMKKTDGLIIASPVYALNVSGLMKTFIDHLAYFYHRPYFFKKHAMIVVTTAGAGAKKVGKYIDETLQNIGYNKRYKLCFINSYTPNGKLPYKTIDKINEQTDKFTSDILNNKIYPPTIKALFYYNMWRAMAYNNHVKEDTKYWKENNMLNSEFYPSIPCNGLKKLPFKIFYKIMINFLSKNTVKSEKT